MTYEFQGTLHRNAREMLDAIAEAWLTADGSNNQEAVDNALADLSDEDLADDCIEDWGLEAVQDDDGQSGDTWLEDRGSTREDLIEAFARLRARLGEGSDA